MKNLKKTIEEHPDYKKYGGMDISEDVLLKEEIDNLIKQTDEGEQDGTNKDNNS